MSWEVASMIGVFGTSFFLLYLKSLLSDQHEELKIGLMMIAFVTVVFGLGQVHAMITESAPLATENISMAQMQYTVYVWLMIAFLAYWGIYMAGRWITAWRQTP